VTPAMVDFVNDGDIYFKIWPTSAEIAYGGKSHVNFLENVFNE